MGVLSAKDGLTDSQRKWLAEQATKNEFFNVIPGDLEKAFDNAYMSGRDFVLDKMGRPIRNDRRLQIPEREDLLNRPKEEYPTPTYFSMDRAPGPDRTVFYYKGFAPMSTTESPPKKIKHKHEWQDHTSYVGISYCYGCRKALDLTKPIKGQKPQHLQTHLEQRNKKIAKAREVMVPLTKCRLGHVEPVDREFEILNMCATGKAVAVEHKGFVKEICVKGTKYINGEMYVCGKTPYLSYIRETELSCTTGEKKIIWSWDGYEEFEQVIPEGVR